MASISKMVATRPTGLRAVQHRYHRDIRPNSIECCILVDIDILINIGYSANWKKIQYGHHFKDGCHRMGLRAIATTRRDSNRLLVCMYM